MKQYNFQIPLLNSSEFITQFEFIQNYQDDLLPYVTEK